MDFCPHGKMFSLIFSRFRHLPVFFFPLTEAMVFTSGTFHGEDQELIDLKHLFQHSKVFDSFKGSNRIVYFMRLLF